jgi:hypothetical protein
MIRKITFVLACFLLFGCAEEKKETMPANLLSKEKMVGVLMDVQLAEAAMTMNPYNADLRTLNNSSLPFDVFAKNKITKQQYNESFDYYSQHPELLDEVYASVLENLSKMQAEVMSKKEEVKVDTVKIEPVKKEKKKSILKKKK